jgi:hypothetical protein
LLDIPPKNPIGKASVASANPEGDERGRRRPDKIRSSQKVSRSGKLMPQQPFVGTRTLTSEVEKRPAKLIP